MTGLSWLQAMRRSAGAIRSRLCRFLGAAPRSLIACAVVVVLNLVTLGALGGGLYYAVGWAMPAGFPQPHDWSGDWVWPAMIGVGMLWPVGFLAAAWLSRCLASRVPAWSVWWRRLGYLLVLWLWAGLLWYFMLATRDSL